MLLRQHNFLTKGGGVATSACVFKGTPIKIVLSILIGGLLSGCASVSVEQPAARDTNTATTFDRKVDYVLPLNAFPSKKSNEPKSPSPSQGSSANHTSTPKPAASSNLALSTAIAPQKSIELRTNEQAIPLPFRKKVWVYDSATTKSFLAKGGFDAITAPIVWKRLLDRYQIPNEKLTNLKQLIQAEAGVLILPSAVALTHAEMQAIFDFRQRGGSILATWLSGVRDEHGQWLGFSFMEKALGVKVVGNTAGAKEVNYVLPHGNSPVTHSLRSGTRVWIPTDRALLPLRLEGGYSAASIGNWSRSAPTGIENSVIRYDEKSFGSVRSRVVVFGFSDNVLISSKPEMIEAFIHNSLMWLLRVPNGYMANWPTPYRAAMVTAVSVNETMNQLDVKLEEKFDKAGIKASYFFLANNAKPAVNILSTFKSKGHELAHQGDRFIGFKDVPLLEQGKRLDSMKKIKEELGLRLPERPGFYAPVESYDANTINVIRSRGFDYYIGIGDMSPDNLPELSPDSAMVQLPRSQMGPEDLAEELDTDEAIQQFTNELSFVQRMNGLSVMRMPNQSAIFSLDEMSELVNKIGAFSSQVWMARASDIAAWWRSRQRVTAKISGDATKPELLIDIKGPERAPEGLTFWINSPRIGDQIRLTSSDASVSSPKTLLIDPWRIAIDLGGLSPGVHKFQLEFVASQ